MLKNPTKFGGICWNCESCLAGATRLQAKLEALQARFHEVEVRVVRNEGAVQDMGKRVDNVEKRQEKVEDIVSKERESLRKERVTEMRERENRKRNVILHRVEEAGQSATSLDERKEWDICSCENIFRAMNLPIDWKAIKFSRRIREQSEEPRPLLIGLTRESMIEDILETANELRNTPFSTVGIVPDLTLEEDHAKNLEWMAVRRRGERRLIKGKARERETAHSWRGRRGSRGRGGTSAPQHLLSTNRGRNSTWAPGRGGRGEVREREELIDLVRGGMTGTRPRTNSKWTRDTDENKEEDRGQPPPQPAATTTN